METEFLNRLREALADHIFPVLAEEGFGEQPYYYVEREVIGEEVDDTVTIHIEAPGRVEDGGLTAEGVQARDRLLVMLYAVYSEESWRAGWMDWSEATRRGFATWLAREFALDQGAPPLEDHQAEALPALREVWQEVGARWLS